jgi:cyanophycinase-like exopeptidase
MDRPLVGGISVDVCRECRGIWFDHGELRKITEIHKTRGLKGDEEVTEQVRQGMRGGGSKGGTLEVLNWFFNSFLGTKLR